MHITSCLGSRLAWPCLTLVTASCCPRHQFISVHSTQHMAHDKNRSSFVQLGGTGESCSKVAANNMGSRGVSAIHVSGFRPPPAHFPKACLIRN